MPRYTGTFLKSSLLYTCSIRIEFEARDSDRADHDAKHVIPLQNHGGMLGLKLVSMVTHVPGT